MVLISRILENGKPWLKLFVMLKHAVLWCLSGFCLWRAVCITAALCWGQSWDAMRGVREDFKIISPWAAAFFVFFKRQVKVSCVRNIYLKSCNVIHRRHRRQKAMVANNNRNNWRIEVPCLKFPAGHFKSECIFTCVAPLKHWGNSECFTQCKNAVKIFKQQWKGKNKSQKSNCTWYFNQ